MAHDDGTRRLTRLIEEVGAARSALEKADKALSDAKFSLNLAKRGGVDRKVVDSVLAKVTDAAEAVAELSRDL